MRVYLAYFSGDNIEVHAHCMGCNEEIKENDKDIVDISLGKAESCGNELTLNLEWELWYGHESCFYGLIHKEGMKTIDKPKPKDRKKFYN